MLFQKHERLTLAYLSAGTLLVAAFIGAQSARLTADTQTGYPCTTTNGQDGYLDTTGECVPYETTGGGQFPAPDGQDPNCTADGCCYELTATECYEHQWYTDMTEDYYSFCDSKNAHYEKKDDCEFILEEQSQSATNNDTTDTSDTTETNQFPAPDGQDPNCTADGCCYVAEDDYCEEYQWYTDMTEDYYSFCEHRGDHVFVKKYDCEQFVESMLQEEEEEESTTSATTSDSNSSTANTQNTDTTNTAGDDEDEFDFPPATNGQFPLPGGQDPNCTAPGCCYDVQGDYCEERQWYPDMEVPYQHFCDAHPGSLMFRKKRDCERHIEEMYMHDDHPATDAAGNVIDGTTSDYEDYEDDEDVDGTEWEPGPHQPPHNVPPHHPTHVPHHPPVEHGCYDTTGEWITDIAACDDITFEDYLERAEEIQELQENIVETCFASDGTETEDLSLCDFEDFEEIDMPRFAPPPLGCFAQDGAWTTNRDDCKRERDEVIDTLIEQLKPAQKKKVEVAKQKIRIEEEHVVQKKMEQRFVQEKNDEQRKELKSMLEKAVYRLRILLENGNLSAADANRIEEVITWLAEQGEIHRSDTTKEQMRETAKEVHETLRSIAHIKPNIDPEKVPEVRDIVAKIDNILTAIGDTIVILEREDIEISEAVYNDYQRARVRFTDARIDCNRDERECSGLESVVRYIEDLNVPLKEIVDNAPADVREEIENLF